MGSKTALPPQNLLEFIRYNPATGKFHWIVSRPCHGGSVNPGDVAGTPKDGYVQIGLNGRIYRAHRLAWYVMTGDWLPSKQDLDHINGDRSDNRWGNLRLATRSENNMNVGKLRPDNKSGVRGVSFRKDTQKWHARIVVRGQTIILGNFTEKNDAITARVVAEKEYFGERLRA